jgi:hypothetical protein
MGYVHPAAIPITETPGWVRRRWIVRTTRTVTAETCATLGPILTQEIAEALLQSGVSAADLERGAPRISLTSLDERHVVAQTDFVGPDAGLGSSLGDASMVATWGTLQRLDGRLGIDELEGLPRECWRPLMLARGAK